MIRSSLTPQDPSYVSQIYHLEALGFADRAQPAAILQRVTIRSNNLDAVRTRAIRLLQRTQTPQWTGEKVEAVRVTDGSGAELFRWSVWDELSGARPS